MRLQNEYLKNIFVNYEPYIENVLKWLYMRKSNHMCPLVIVRSLNVNKCLFRTRENEYY